MNLLTGHPSRRAQWLLVAAVVVFGGVIRFHGLASESLWLDEIFSVEYVARRGFADAVGDTFSYDYHPFLYYALLDAWTAALGHGDVVTRALSALLGTAGIAAAYALGRQVAGIGAGLLTASLVALSPAALLYSQEVRMYGLAIGLWPLCLASLVRLLDHGGSPTARLALLCSCFLLCYTQGTSGALVLPFVSCVLGWHIVREFRAGRKQNAAAGLFLLGALALLYLPWALRLAMHVRSPAHARPLDGAAWLRLVRHLVFGVQVPYRPAAVLGLVAVAVLLLLFLAKGASFGPGFAVLAASLVGIPLTQWALHSVKPCYHPRNLVFLLVPLLAFPAVTAVKGLRRARESKRQSVRLAVLLPAAGLACMLLLASGWLTLRHIERGAGREQWREAVAYFAHHAARDDRVVFYANVVERCFNHYLYGYDGGSAATGQRPRFATYGVARTRNAAGLGKELGSVLDDLNHAPEGAALWVFYSHVPNAAMVDRHLVAGGLRGSHVWQGIGIELWRYVPAAAGTLPEQAQRPIGTLYRDAFPQQKLLRLFCHEVRRIFPGRPGYQPGWVHGARRAGQVARPTSVTGAGPR